MDDLTAWGARQPRDRQLTPVNLTSTDLLPGSTCGKRNPEFSSALGCVISSGVAGPSLDTRKSLPPPLAIDNRVVVAPARASQLIFDFRKFGSGFAFRRPALSTACRLTRIRATRCWARRTAIRCSRREFAGTRVRSSSADTDPSPSGPHRSPVEGNPSPIG